MSLATCIGCSCDDLHACHPFGCSWLVVDRRVGLGVCDNCPGHHWQRFLELKHARWFVAVHYKIDVLSGSRWVNGYAVRLPAPFSGLRFCLREEGGEWVVDHFDSGKAVTGPTMTADEHRHNVVLHVQRWRRRGGTRGAVVKWLVEYLGHLRRSGKLRKVMHKFGYGWCLQDAGL